MVVQLQPVVGGERIVIDLSVPSSHEPFKIVIVSSSDVSRGPAIHHILRAHLRLTETDTETVISSAGTLAVAGEGLDTRTGQALVETGLVEDADVLEQHRAHRLSERRLAQADLVLAVARDERRRAAELRPAVRARSFTVVEFARLVSALPETPDDARRLVRQAAGLRAAVRPVDPAEDDLESVAGRSERDHERIVRRIDHAVADVARGLSRTLVGAAAHWA